MMQFAADKFFAQYRTEFGPISTAMAADTGMIGNLNRVLGAFAADPLITNVYRPAYMLATMRVETAGTYAPIEERGGAGYYIRMYSPTSTDPHRAFLARQNGMRSAADALAYHGNGFVQLTWRNNYIRASAMLQRRYGVTVDLEADPTQAREFDTAYKVMSAGMDEGLFTGKGFKNYSPVNYLAQRRIINGLDRAQEIADYAVKFEHCLRAAQVQV